MKSGEEIVRFIDTFYQWYLEKPTSYFQTPEVMEAVLMELERVHSFIVDPESGMPPRWDGYAQFLAEQGYGAGRHCEIETFCKPEDFQPLVEFWRRYLVSGQRTPNG